MNVRELDTTCRGIGPKRQDQGRAYVWLGKVARAPGRDDQALGHELKDRACQRTIKVSKHPRALGDRYRAARDGRVLARTKARRIRSRGQAWQPDGQRERAWQKSNLLAAISEP